MRWVRYELEGRETYGIVEDDVIVDVRGDPFSAHERSTSRRPFDSVKLLPPVMPRTLYAAGLNYAEHVTALASKTGETPKLPCAADIGYRGTNGLIAHNETVVIPREATERVQYEAELVVVIGRRARHLSEHEALQCVLGYTIGNDVSERRPIGDAHLARGHGTSTELPGAPGAGLTQETVKA